MEIHASKNNFSEPEQNLLAKIPNFNQSQAPQLVDLWRRFPKVQEGFEKFLDTSPFKRIQLAAQILENTPRSGWLRFGLEKECAGVLATHAGEYYGKRILIFEEKRKTESVLEHSIEAQEIFAFVYSNGRQWGAEVLKFHDFCEAIIGDFTPLDKITRDEKSFLEKIALEVLCESRASGDLLARHVYNCNQIFTGAEQSFENMQQIMFQEIRAGIASQRVGVPQLEFVAFLSKIYAETVDIPLLKQRCNDIDALQMLNAGRRIIVGAEYNISTSEALKEWQGFADYIQKKLQTPEAQLFCRVYLDYFRSPETHLNTILDMLSAFEYWRAEI